MPNTKSALPLISKLDSDGDSPLCSDEEDGVDGRLEAVDFLNRDS